MDTVPTILIVDDDPAFVQALTRLLRAEGFATRAWTSVQRFLAEHDPEGPGCLITDLAMPEMNGLDLQRELRTRQCARPIVFLTGCGDMLTAVAGMRAGAVNFLAKPVRRAVLVETLREAMARDAAERAAHAERRRLQHLLDTLTPRERQVLDFVARGLLNKQIAGVLGTAEKTIKVHRGRLLHKMRVKSAAALVQLLAQGESSRSRWTHPAPMASALSTAAA